jgi:hypothetical protein
VDTRWIQGHDNFGYGLIFRVNPDGDFYLFWIAAKGYFIAGRAEGQEFLPFVTWTYSDSINQRGRNTLSVEANGTDLQFFINGDLVLTAQDSAYLDGGFGFYTQAGVKAGFDNLRVWDLTF